MKKRAFRMTNGSMRRLVLGAASATIVLFCSLPAIASQWRDEAVPIPVSILLLIPERFEQFTYTSFVKGRETVHDLGEEAEDQFRRLLGPEFEMLVIKPAGSEAEALDMLSPDSPDNAEVRTYDYVAIPKFISVTASSKAFHYQFEVEILLEIYSADNSTVTKIKGYGKTTAGNLASMTPHDAANRALWNAIDAIRDGIEGKRAALIPTSASSAPKSPQVAMHLESAQEELQRIVTANANDSGDDEIPGTSRRSTDAS